MRTQNPTPITYADMKPGDIILSGGTDLLDRILKTIDQSPYSHTTFFVGMNGLNPIVIEATTDGIIEDTIKRDMDEQSIMDVYRWSSPEGNHLGDPGWSADDIIAQARSFVGGKYCYSELLLGGLAILLVDETDSKIAKEAVRIWGAIIERWLEDWIQSNTGKTPMTCVQVATTSFWNADPSPARKYGILVKVDGTRHNVHLPDHVRELRKAKAKIKSLLFNDNSELPGLVIKAGSYDLPSGTCTPRDMMDSPSLTYIGTLKDVDHGIKPPYQRGTD